MHLRHCGHDFVLPNIKYDFIARSLFYYVSILRLCFMWTCMYCMNCFFSSIVLCVCFLCKHVRFSCVFCNKLTYLLVNVQRHVGGFTQETNNFAVIRWSVRCSGTNDSWEERQFGTTGLKFDTSFYRAGLYGLSVRLFVCYTRSL